MVLDLSIGAGMQVAKDVINGTIILDEVMMDRIAITSWDAIKKWYLLILFMKKTAKKYIR